MEFLVKNKTVGIKFSYGLMFKMNKKMGSVSKETGERGKDGVGQFFLRILDRDDTAIVDLIQLVDKSATEDDAIKAIENLVDEENVEESYSNIFKELEDEMVESGFFRTKISQYIENMEQAIQMLKARKDEDSKAQAEVIRKMVSRLKDALN